MMVVSTRVVVDRERWRDGEMKRWRDEEMKRKGTG
jgi:hypothetical protein